ncbi:HNH endonuclease [Bradyrhizobium sp. PUT101]|uniref:HNH endonuclease n=1 Tax=Bradyrhizobium sp. PUT101 TaxID=3447427 RepID=UPI003F824306
MEEEFDAPLFKVLAKNDTGKAASNQGGPVIPKDLQAYLPKIERPPGVHAPGMEIDAILMIGLTEVDRVKARYQVQTWGGTRLPGEFRITRIPAIHKESNAGDIFVVERSLVNRNLLRLTLLKQGTDQFSEASANTRKRKSGLVIRGLPPATDVELVTAEKEQVERETKAFEMFDKEAVKHETKSRKVARSRAFLKLVGDYYSGKCCLCGQGLMLSAGKWETEAAHIVPRGKEGADDARNGLALCRSHHWAFDQGMWGIMPDGKVMIRSDIEGHPQNASLVAFKGKELTKPSDVNKAPHAEALAWHIANIVNRPEPASS